MLGNELARAVRTSQCFAIRGAGGIGGLDSIQSMSSMEGITAVSTDCKVGAHVHTEL